MAIRIGIFYVANRSAAICGIITAFVLFAMVLAIVLPLTLQSQEPPPISLDDECDWEIYEIAYYTTPGLPPDEGNFFVITGQFFTDSNITLIATLDDVNYTAKSVSFWNSTTLRFILPELTSLPTSVQILYGISCDAVFVQSYFGPSPIPNPVPTHIPTSTPTSLQPVYAHFLFPNTINRNTSVNLALNIHGTKTPTHVHFREISNGSTEVIQVTPIATNVLSIEISRNFLSEGIFDAIIVSDNIQNTLSRALTVIDPSTAMSLSGTSITPTCATIGIRNSTFSIFGSTFAEPCYVYLVNSGIATLSPSQLMNSGEISVSLPNSIQTSGEYEVHVICSNGFANVGTGISVYSGTIPVISHVSATFIDSSPKELTINGSGFTSGTTVSMHCQQQASTTVLTTMFTITATTVVSSTQITTNLTTTGSYSDWATCTLRVTTSSGNYAEFPGISTSVNAQGDGIGALQTGTSMTLPRRSFAMVSGTIPSTSKSLLYAIGSDVSSDTNSVEAIFLDQYGNFKNSWTILSESALPNGFSDHSAVVIEGNIYIVSGTNGTSGFTTVYRAEILDPTEAPIVTWSVSLNLEKYLKNDTVNPNPNLATDFAPGLWYYQVSNVYSSSDSRNSNGESLPSIPVAITIPPIRGISITLQWNSDPHASAYRVYRSPYAGAPLSSVVLLTTTTSTSLTDDYLLISNYSKIVLPLGSLGTWTLMPSLSYVRIGGSLVVNSDSSERGKYWLYIISGISSYGSNPRTDYEYATITVSSKVHTMSSWTSSSTGTVPARAFSSGVIVSVNDIPSGEIAWGSGLPYIFLGCGETSISGASDTISIAEITTSGTLGTFSNSTACNKAMSGYCGALSSGTLVYAGGGTDAQSTDPTELAITTNYITVSSAPTLAGALSNFTTFPTRRSRLGCTVALGHIYFAGGYTDIGSGTNEVQMVVG